ncbi:MAG: hypothetical protein BMS9Abin12_1221 [Acidimicrobiia bacterium]|nr:MAG: hypothetical protein BMS9Abin12_1221 [Acidimicrobiia bacterium]
MPTTQPMPPVALIVSYTVADFDIWKAVFDAGEDRRRSASIVGHHINRTEDDPNALSIYFPATDVGSVKAFTSSEDLKAVMAEAGVTSAPEMAWVTPVRDAVVWDRELPAFIITHTVADFDSWLRGYDDADELRAAKGILGHAANRSMDDPSVATVYHQAESFDTLRAFLADEELKAAMERAGVTSEPAVSWYTGGWGRRY